MLTSELARGGSGRPMRLGDINAYYPTQAISAWAAASRGGSAPILRGAARGNPVVHGSHRRGGVCGGVSSP